MSTQMTHHSKRGYISWSQTKTLLLSSLVTASLSACNSAEPQPGQEIAPGVRLLAYMSNMRIKESSGAIASRRYANVFWIHNDGGGPKKQVLYAIDREGNTRAAFRVTGATFHDWEDIAIDDAGHLFLGDIGNNDAKRDILAVYEIDEPDPTANISAISPKRNWTLKFPNAPFDCESLFTWKNYGYVISKLFNKEHAQIFRVPADISTRALRVTHAAHDRLMLAQLSQASAEPRDVFVE